MISVHCCLFVTILFIVQDTIAQRVILETIILPNTFDEISTRGKFDVLLVQAKPNKPSKLEISGQVGKNYNVTYRLSESLPRLLTIDVDPMESESILVRIHFNKTFQRYFHRANGDISTGRTSFVNPGSQKLIFVHLGPGLVTMKLNVSEFLAILHGSGDYEFSGHIRRSAVYNIKNFAFVNAFSLKSKETIVSVSGNSTVEVTAIDKFKIEANDMAQVLYRFSRTLQSNETSMNQSSLIQRVI